MKMKRFTFHTVMPAFLLLFFCVLSPQGYGQENPEKSAREARKYINEAEDALEEGEVASAEALYRQAISKDPSNATARYNLGNLYYEEEISNEAIQRHSQAGSIAEEKTLKHKSYHNQGNSFMDQKKYPEAIKAYKNALRNNPTDDETRYNLALAKKLWEEDKKGGGEDDNENEGQQQNEQNQPKENQDQQQNQGDQEKNDQGKPEDQEDGENKDKGQPDENKEGQGEPKKQNQGEGDKKQQQQQPTQQQPQPGQLSPQQVKSLLEAMGNQEKKVQDKMNAEKVKGVPTRSEKDW